MQLCENSVKWEDQMQLFKLISKSKFNFQAGTKNVYFS